jgi:hypothetical protein
MDITFNTNKFPIHYTLVLEVNNATDSKVNSVVYRDLEFKIHNTLIPTKIILLDELRNYFK